ncbi:MAG: GyrI-like domain-containing protein [Caldisericia bacterium]|nr:GyrI-like domain-containing protein [Caldisericia bacterium]
MDKLDLKKELKGFYNPSKKEVSSVDIPEMNFLMIDGQGNPNTSEEYQQALEVLYGLSYTLKFACKEIEKDFTVMPLEGLWWADDMDSFTEGDKDLWKWTAMILQPDFVTAEMLIKAKINLKKKKDPVALPKVRFESYTGGTSAQIMHIGPYSEEASNIKKIHDWIKGNGFKLFGKHHEIYLSDPRRTKPEKLKTVIRQPYR